jgi:hypothetical protein
VAHLAGCSALCETRHTLLISELLLLGSRPNRLSCRGRPPSLDQRSYKRVAHLAGCSAPCETQHTLLISELLLLGSRPNRLSCRDRPPSLDRRSYKRVAHLAGCSAHASLNTSCWFLDDNCIQNVAILLAVLLMLSYTAGCSADASYFAETK